MYNSKSTHRKRRNLFFIVLMAIQAIIEFVIGVMLLFNFPETLKSGFGITYTSELDVLGIALGLYLLLLASLMISSIVWTIKRNASGAVIGIIAGIFLFLFGFAAFIKLGDTQALYIDSIRGFVTFVLGYMTFKEIKEQDQNV